MTVYELITQAIIEKLQQGVVPWRKPWKTNVGFPRNLISGKPYRGINVLLLSMLGFDSPWFLTFKQALERGGCVRKGSKGFPVVFWKFPKRDEEEATEEQDAKGKSPILRYYAEHLIMPSPGPIPGVKYAGALGIIAPPEAAVKRRRVKDSSETPASDRPGDNAGGRWAEGRFSRAPFP